MAGGDVVETVHKESGLETELGRLRCLECRGALEIGASLPPDCDHISAMEGRLSCARCGQGYPIVGGTPRMLGTTPASRVSDTAEVRHRTAESFAYEWKHFGELREEWALNFRRYMRPHEPESFRDRLVLDVGAGSGRHSYEAYRHGARVVAVDLGDAIDVARRNLPPDVMTVQADAEELPFNEGSFDFVMSIGVLHHLPNPQRALSYLARFVRPGGYLHVYVYWVPSRAWHRSLLGLVTSARRVTTRMPRPLLRTLSYPMAAALFGAFVLPYRIARRVPALQRFADVLPLKAYADYPFGVCVNDQFDRFSAPLEWRFTADEVESMLRGAGLDDVVVLENNGWVGSGRRPSLSQRS